MQKGRRLHSEAATEYLHTDADSSIVACRFVFSFVVSKRACASLTRTLACCHRASERENLYSDPTSHHSNGATTIRPPGSGRPLHFLPVSDHFDMGSIDDILLPCRTQLCKSHAGSSGACGTQSWISQLHCIACMATMTSK
jgi:hypothetical protein